MTEWMKGNQVERRSADGDLGGTMRLGGWRRLSAASGTKVHEIHGVTSSANGTAIATRSTSTTSDRLEQVGLRFSGMSPDGILPEIVEILDHPRFIGVQYHPAPKSRPFAP